MMSLMLEAAEAITPLAAKVIKVDCIPSNYHQACSVTYKTKEMYKSNVDV